MSETQQAPPIDFQGTFPPVQPGDWCKVVRPAVSPKEWFGGYLLGPAFAGVNVHVARSSQNNEIASIRTRVVAERPVPSPDRWDELLTYVDEIPKACVAPTEWDAWISRFDGSRVKLLEQARLRCRQNLVCDKDLQRYSCFVKREIKLSGLIGTTFEEVKPRNIMSAPDVCKVNLGPTFHAYAKHLHQVWNSESPIFYECGATAEAVSEWVQTWSAKLGCLLETDFSKYDMTNSTESFRFKFKAAQRLGLRGYESHVYSLLFRPAQFVTRHGVVARRASPGTLTGHPDTSWGNTITNIFVHWYSLVEAWRRDVNPSWTHAEARASPLSPHPGRDFAICARGDDMIGAIHPGLQCHIQTMKKVMSELGLVPKVRSAHSILQARFCSNAFYPTAEGRLVLAPTMKCLLKMCFTISDVGRTERTSQLQHLRGVALSLLALTNHVPLLNDMVQQLLQLTAGAKGKWLSRATREARYKYMPVEHSHAEAPDSVAWLASQLSVPIWCIQGVRAAIPFMAAPGFYNSTAIEMFVRAVASTEAL